MVKVLDRESINRMVRRRGSGGVGGGGGGSDIDLSSYATKSWTDDNYVGKEFFSSLFKAYDSNGNEVLPNDTDTQIENIKAMFGFWTDFYISALGTGGQQSVGLRLAQLADVNVAGVTNGQVLTYDTTSGKWIASTPQAGTDMATVWANLAANGDRQINYSHLSGAVSLSNGTITIGSSSITPITSHQSLAGYAKEQWVSQNYLSKNNAAETYLSKTAAASTYLSIAFFNRLFKAYNGTTQVNPNNTTTAIDNIKAMFGFWTEFYVSALGTGGQQSVGLRLAQLADVNVAGVTNGQVLTYDSTTGKWIASTPQAGTDMATVWANLAASGNQQIDASHLTTALTGYATQTWVGQQGYITRSALTGYATKTWVGQQGYITASAISDMATKTWVGQQGYITASAISDMATKTWVGQNYLGLHAIADAAAKLATPRTLWGQSFNGTANVSGDMSSVGDIALGNGKRIYNAAQGSGGSLYIGRSDDAGWVKISDMCSRQGDSYWKIYSSGGAYFSQYVTALSDARHKNVQGDIALTVEMVAKAPAVKFTWKDEKKPGLFVGSLAQYWKMALPEVVREQGDGTLSLDYQVTALMAAIVTARKVENHESRLRRLEKMFALNENDIED